MSKESDDLLWNRVNNLQQQISDLKTRVSRLELDKITRECADIFLDHYSKKSPKIPIASNIPRHGPMLFTFFAMGVTVGIGATTVYNSTKKQP